ncbi:MAG: FAD-dependent oxidoreductase [Deltaproteobacteria bacterium]|nr:FAD-dependent oxidoreductase [Deltaproteobacteria bacterium]
MASKPLPEQARVVIIGGGIIGTSVAYHLAHAGWKDVVVLERHKLTAGSTWHAAGLMVTFGTFSEVSMQMRLHTRHLCETLEEETGQATGYMPIGFIELASDRDRLEEYRRVAAFNRHCGVDVQEISPSEVKALFPLAKVDDIHAGFYVEKDGRVNPVDLTMALAKGARMQGATFIEDIDVEDVLHERGRVTSVRTAEGDIRCEYVVNCAGVWARQLGEKSGIVIPGQAAEHYYLITEAIPEISRSWPVIEDPGCHGYYREEGGGLMIGLFEPVCAPWKVEGVPEDFAFGEIPPDWERMTPFLERAMSRVPISLEVGVKKFFCGPEAFTPDLLPVVGESKELRNYFVGAGMNSIGILTGGGLGRILAHWIMNGRPDVDVTGFNIDRLHPYQNNPEYRAKRTVESLGMVFQAHYPTRAALTARDAKRSPFHDRLAARGAYFRDVSGWEGADWYAPEGGTPDPGPLSWGRMKWFDQWAAEHRAAREGVILMDMSFMSKFLVQGRDAGAVLEWVSANEVSAEAGKVVYTQWLDEEGKLQADLTVSKLDDETYWVVASDTAHGHVETWLRRAIEDRQAHAFVTDVTGAYGQLNLQGPRARELMQQLTSVDMSDEAFPFRSVKTIDLGLARVRCIRITYLGELGYELYIPTEQAVVTYDRIVEAGERHGLKHAGLKALASLRMEKGYRDFGHDIDNTDTVLEAGLGFAVALDKPGGFLGREAVAAQKASKVLHSRLLQILVKDPEPMMWHGEIVYRDGVAVGYIRAASYGHTLGGAVGLCMASSATPIKKAFWEEGSWEVEIAGKRYPAVASLRPLYDPKNEKIRC